MRMSESDWVAYINRLSRINKAAADKVRKWVELNGLGDAQALIDYAYAVATKYGEASASLAAEMYDATAAAEGAIVPPAEVAETATYDDVAKTVNGITKKSSNIDLLADAVGRLVKRAGADTTLKNAERDGAQFAWIPHGDTCSFCLTLASRGWQYMSKQAMKNGHAEHIHANCDCTYATRHDGKSTVEGYDPDKYLQMYNNADGRTPQEKINAMRREQYAQNKDEINEQKRAAYALKNHKTQSGGKITGGHHYPTENNEDVRVKQAAAQYEKFARVDDSKKIAQNTGYTAEEIQRVRSHIFFDKHDLIEGYRRFDPDYDMAVAWKRLQNNRYLPRDITLLNHELLESQLEKEYNISAEEAHKRAQKKFNWARQLLNETEGKGEADGLL